SNPRKRSSSINGATRTANNPIVYASIGLRKYSSMGKDLGMGTNFENTCTETARSTPSAGYVAHTRRGQFHRNASQKLRLPARMAVRYTKISMTMYASSSAG